MNNQQVERGYAIVNPPKQLKINGEVVEAIEFAYDGCHKIYLIRNDAEHEEMEANGYDEGDILPVSELPRVWKETCGLRFISPSNLEGPDFVRQGEDATVTYE